MKTLSRGQQQALLWLVMAAVLWRWLLAQRTPVPSEDGVSYLWMAQQFANGEFAAGLEPVFPPGLPLLLAPLLLLGVEPLVAGQLLGCVCGGLLLLPLALVAQALQPGAAVPAAVLCATASRLCCNAAEVYSEPPFLLLLALGTVAGLRQRWWWLGLCSGLALLLRPEAALLPLAFAATAPRQAWRALLPLAAAVLLLALARGIAGHGFDPLPIRQFHELRDDLPGRGDLLANLLAVPGAWLEAFGPAGLLPLLLLPRAAPRAARPLLLQLLLNVLVIGSFVVRWRFLLSAAVPVLALAAAGARRLRPWPCWLAIGVCAGFGVHQGWTGVTAPDRAAERAVGRYLGSRLHPGERIAGDLPCVLFYAGLPPPPPRHFGAAQQLAMAAAPEVRFVVLSQRSKQGTYAAVAAGLAAEFARLELPAGLAEAAARRGLAVFVRR